LPLPQRATSFNNNPYIHHSATKGSESVSSSLSHTKASNESKLLEALDEQSFKGLCSNIRKLT